MTMYIMMVMYLEEIKHLLYILKKNLTFVKNINVMKIRIEIDPFTKSGRKAYEFIESLKNKDGITYLNEHDILSDEEVKELEKSAIEILDEIQDDLFPYENKKDSIIKRTNRSYKRNPCVAGTKTKKFI